MRKNDTGEIVSPAIEAAHTGTGSGVTSVFIGIGTHQHKGRFIIKRARDRVRAILSSKGMDMTQSTYGRLLAFSAGMTSLAVMSLLAVLLFSGDLIAQTPESTLRTAGQESTFLISLWWIGSFVIGLALAYGIWRTWGRSRADKQRTERATKELYTEEQRREDRSRR